MTDVPIADLPNVHRPEPAGPVRRLQLQLRTGLRSGLQRAGWPMLRERVSTWRSPLAWRDLARPQLLAVLVVLGSGVYCFGIGRDRYQAVSEFVVRQPLPPSTVGSALLNPSLSSPTVLGSLEDGRFLQVYLSSPDVMQRLYPDPGRLAQLYAPRPPDRWSGLPAGGNRDQELTFFQRQLAVVPQELSGVIQITTTGFAAEQALELNKALLEQAKRFVNEVNQSISTDQRQFAEQEVARARGRLALATQALNAFQSEHGQLNPLLERDVTTNFIAAMESRLVDLKVEEASLRRQFRDPQAPEVAFVTDQVRELERQIREERAKVVSPGGRDLSRLTVEAQALENEVTFATEMLKSAMMAADNSRMESQRQLKFLVMLREPQLPAQPEQSWRWKAFLASLGGLLVVWGVGGFLVGVVKRA
jgi:capsular polysaccharide transport system permease protein